MNQTAFDGPAGSGYWMAPSMPAPAPAPHPHSMPPHTYAGPRYASGEDRRYASGEDRRFASGEDRRYASGEDRRYASGEDRRYANGEDRRYGRSPSRSHQASNVMSPAPALNSPPAGRFQIDPEIAKSWSGQSEEYEIAGPIFNGPELRKSWSGDGNHENQRQPSSPRNCRPQRDGAGIARPDIVKRMTSNQNEDSETKRDYMGDGRSIKRAALNRDNSMASNRLKEAYAPGALKKPAVLDNEMRSLSVSMEQSSLGTRPRPLAYEERTSTMDMFAMEMLTKPTPLDSTDRSTTIDEIEIELGIDLDDEEGLLTPSGFIPKPPRLRTEGRLTTAEYFDIVNEPLGDD